MSEHVDNTGWATFGTVVGMFTAAHELTQFGTAMFTLITGIVIAHFLKRFLNKHWPSKGAEDAQEND